MEIKNLEGEIKMPSGRLAEHIAAHAIEVLRRVEVSKYCLGIHVAGQRFFYSMDRRIEEDDSAGEMRTGFRLGCMFRPFLAAAALQMCNSGRLSLDTAIGEVFPQLSGTNQGRSVRIRHLLSHTTGYLGFSRISAAHAFQDRESDLVAVRRAPRVFQPGQVYNYEHSATALLGEALERISGIAVRKLVEDIVFTPLAIRDVNCSNVIRDEMVSRIGDPQPKIGKELLSVAVSVPTLLSSVEMLMGESGSETCDRGLSCQTRELMRGPVVHIPRIANSVAWKMLATGSGLGLHMYRSGIFGHEGNTGSQAIGFRFDPMHKIAIVLGINKSNQHLARRAIFGALFNLVDEYCGRRKAGRDVLPHAFDIAELIGDYYGDHDFYVRVTADRESILVTTLWKSGFNMSVVGKMSDLGYPIFESNSRGAEPSFFRLSPSGDPCVVMGMCTLRKQKRWFSRTKIYFRLQSRGSNSP